VDRPASVSYKDGEGPSRKGSRPNSVLSASQLSADNEAISPPARPISQSIATQTDVSRPAPPPLDPIPEPKREIVTYSKAVQTDEWTPLKATSTEAPLESEDGEFQPTSPSSKRLSKKLRERDEEIRDKLGKEIEEELRATKQLTEDGPVPHSTKLRYPLRTLTDDELNAVTSSEEFLDFVERSSKVIERALDEEYDVLADYELGGVNAEEEEEDEYGKRRREIKEVTQFWDERWSKKRMISDLSFSPKVR
jgi:dynein intermediate chain, cytosolic